MVGTMNILKLSSIIILYFLSRVAFASECETYTGFKIKEKLCFDKSLSGWISEKCIKDKNCQAKKFFEIKKKVTLPELVGGQNPAAIYCHRLKLEILILKDSNDNEQSFCQFPDQTIVDANAIEGFLE
jgi:putative hemolysin